MPLEKIDLSVPAMSCGNCVNNIKATLSVLDGVSDVAPSLETKRVTVSFEPSKVTPKQITTALAKLGFATS